MLDAKDADRPFAPDDRHAGKAVVAFLARLGLVGEVWMARGFVEVQDLDIVGDRAVAASGGMRHEAVKWLVNRRLMHRRRGGPRP